MSEQTTLTAGSTEAKITPNVVFFYEDGQLTGHRTRYEVAKAFTEL